MQNKGKIIAGLRRYLFYNYDITDLIENVVGKSLKNIENIKSNYGDSDPKEEKKRRKTGFMQVFSKILKTPEKDKKPMLKFSQIKKVPLKMQPMIEKLQKKNPFEKLMLLKVDKEKVKFVPKEEFKKNQNEIYQRESEHQAAEFIVEFNEIIIQIGKKFKLKN